MTEIDANDLPSEAFKSYLAGKDSYENFKKVFDNRIKKRIELLSVECKDEDYEGF